MYFSIARKKPYENNIKIWFSWLNLLILSKFYFNFSHFSISTCSDYGIHEQEIVEMHVKHTRIQNIFWVSDWIIWWNIVN